MRSSRNPSGGVPLDGEKGLVEPVNVVVMEPEGEVVRREVEALHREADSDVYHIMPMLAIAIALGINSSSKSPKKIKLRQRVIVCIKTKCRNENVMLQHC